MICVLTTRTPTSVVDRTARRAVWAVRQGGRVHMHGDKWARDGVPLWLDRRAHGESRLFHGSVQDELTLVASPRSKCTRVVLSPRDKMVLLMPCNGKPLRLA